MKKWICPQNCEKRCAEPSCRATCETWKKHVQEQEETEKRKEQARTGAYSSKIRESKIKKQMMRKKAGRP